MSKEFKTIKDKELKKKVDNIIDRVLFARHYKEFELKEKTNQLKEVLEIIELVNKIKGENEFKKYLKDQFRQIKQATELNIETLNKPNEIEEKFIDEVDNAFELIDNDKYRVYDIDYFLTRMTIFEADGYTKDFDEEEKELIKKSNYKVGK